MGIVKASITGQQVGVSMRRCCRRVPGSPASLVRACRSALYALRYDPHQKAAFHLNFRGPVQPRRVKLFFDEPVFALASEGHRRGGSFIWLELDKQQTLDEGKALLPSVHLPCRPMQRTAEL